MRIMKNSRIVEVQRLTEDCDLPSDEQLQLWVERALEDYAHNAEVVIRIVDIRK